MNMSDCIFCRILAGEVESRIRYRDEKVFVIEDIEPKAPIHLLIIPVIHKLDINVNDEQDLVLLGSMVHRAGDMAIKEGIEKSGYRLVINQGSNAGQVVPHLHMHLLGGASLAGMA
jgi:histidine triad (HIT) family protein